MADANRERLRAILEAASANTSAPPGSNERKMGDYYASCLDTAAIDARGIQPLQPDLDRIAAIHSVRDLTAALTEFQRVAGGGQRQQPGVGPFVLTGAQDRKNSEEIIANVAASGLSLPARDYYLKQDAKSKESAMSF